MITRLSRNRNYRLLWGSRALSEFGSNATEIVFPLLVLSITASPATVGLVMGASAAASLFVGLLAGAFVDRWDRKKVMLGCEAGAVAASVSLVLALWTGTETIKHVVIVASVFGVCEAMFIAAEEACLPNLVPNGQLPTAVSLNAARSHIGDLGGTAVGGFLFTVGKAVPFAVDLLTHIMSLFALLFLRVPPRHVQPQPLSHVGQEMVVGMQWMWRHRPLRIIGLLAIGLNIFFSAYFVIITVLAQVKGVSPGQIGIMVSMMGVGGILGSLMAPYLYRRLSPYLSIIGVFWALTLLMPLAIFISNGYLMGMLFAAMALLLPTAETTVHTYQLLLTPDDLRGRISSVMGVVVGIATVVGPALGGILMEATSGYEAVLLCAAGITIVTVLGAINPTLRKFPRHAVSSDSSATWQLREQGSSHGGINSFSIGAND
jgi:predicted MFS family arabinose efflux permease